MYSYVICSINNVTVYKPQNGNMALFQCSSLTLILWHSLKETFNGFRSQLLFPHPSFKLLKVIAYSWHVYTDSYDLQDNAPLSKSAVPVSCSHPDIMICVIAYLLFFFNKIIHFRKGTNRRFLGHT